MSGLMNLFGSGQSGDNANFQYDPFKQKKATQQRPAQQSSFQQTGIAFQSQIQLFHYDAATKENQSYGVATLSMQKTAAGDGFQLLAYKEKENPYINFLIQSSLSWTLRNKIYAYLKDPNGVQWTMTFHDPEIAARASITFGSIISPITDNTVSTFDITPGTGDLATTNDDVVVSYMGFSGNNLPQTGGKFDSNDNFKFTIGSTKIIKGYSIGVDQMKVGGSRVVLIPPDFGYGSQSIPGKIPPNATLAFFITLNSVTSNSSPETLPQQQEDTTNQQQVPSLSSQPTKPPTMTNQPQDHQNDKNQEENQKKHRRSSAARNEAKMREKEKKRQELERIKQKEAEQFPTADEEDILTRIDQLSELIQSKYDSLVLEAPIPRNDRDLVYEVQALAAQIAGQEIKLRKNKEIIDELQRTKKHSRLRAELDAVQAELDSLKMSLKGGMDFRKENEELKREIKDLTENQVGRLQDEIAEIRSQLSNEKEISKHALSAKAKDLFYQFMGTSIEKLQTMFEGSDGISAKTVINNVYDVFNQCQIDIFEQIDKGMLSQNKTE